MQLNGKSALVTGAARGIGRAIAEQLATEGAQVLLCDTEDEAGRRAVADIRASGGSAAYFHLDVTDPEANRAAVARAEMLYGGLDVAVNNVGISGELRKAADHTPDTWNQVIEIYLSGVFYGIRTQVPAMLRRGGGSIVNISCIRGQMGHVDLAPYVAAKHGVVGLTRTVALEYGRESIRCNAVGPAFALKRHFAEVRKHAKEDSNPTSQLGEVKEFAVLVSFLASDQAILLNGNYFTV